MKAAMTRRKKSLSIVARRQQLFLNEARSKHVDVLQDQQSAENKLQQERQRYDAAEVALGAVLASEEGIDLERLHRTSLYVQAAQDQLDDSIQRFDAVSEKVEAASRQLNETALQARLYENALVRAVSELNTFKASKDQESDIELWLTSQRREITS